MFLWHNVGQVAEERGKIYIIDLYLQKTYKNLKRNPIVSITSVDEHNFKGFTLQGKARVVPREDIKEHIMQRWEEKIINRISKRVVKGVQLESKSHALVRRVPLRGEA